MDGHDFWEMSLPHPARDVQPNPEERRSRSRTVLWLSTYAGAAAFLSTPSDLVRFGIGINSRLRQGSGAQGGKLLKPGTVQLLQTPQRLASGEETGYGLGWELETYPLAGQPTRMAGHGSKAEFIGGTTSLMTFPERGLVVAVMANMSFADTKSIALNIAQAFADQGRSPARQ